MKVRHLIQNIIDSMENPTLDDVWREVIAYVVVAGSKLNISKEEIARYLDSRKDLIKSEGVYYYGADIQEG